MDAELSVFDPVKMKQETETISGLITVDVEDDYKQLMDSFQAIMASWESDVFEAFRQPMGEALQQLDAARGKLKEIPKRLDAAYESREAGDKLAANIAESIEQPNWAMV